MEFLLLENNEILSASTVTDPKDRNVSLFNSPVLYALFWILNPFHS